MIVQYAGWMMAAVFAVAWLFAEQAAATWKDEAGKWESYYHAIKGEYCDLKRQGERGERR